MPGTSTLGRLHRAFRPELARQRWLLFGSFAALGGEILLKSLEPWPIKWVIDFLAGRAEAPSQLGAAGLLATAGLSLVAISSTRALMSYANTLGFSVAGTRILTAVRIRLIEHLHRLSLAFHHRQRTGDLVQRLGRDVDLMKEVLVTAFLPLIGNLLTLLVLFGVMVAMNWRLALAAILMVPVFVWSAARLVPRIQDAARKQRTREGATAAQLTETLGAIREVQSLSLEDNVAGQAAARERLAAQHDVSGRAMAARLERSVDVLTAVASALVLGFGALLARQGQVSPGDLVVFLAYLKSAFKPMQDLAKYTGRLAKALVAGERVLEVLDQVPDIQDQPGAIDAPPLKGHLQFDAVWFGYRTERPVLMGCSLSIEPGSTVAIVGESGQGKTTIASLLLRLYDPNGGAVRIDGHDLRDLRLTSLRRQIALVPQESILFGLSIRANLMVGNPDATPADLERAARLVNAHQFVVALPQGYDTVLGERGAMISTGQRQRLALARAALRSTPILILDEPTAGLDQANRDAVVDAIGTLAHGRTTLLITHDPALADRADRILRLEQGRLTEELRHAVA